MSWKAAVRLQKTLLSRHQAPDLGCLDSGALHLAARLSSDWLLVAAPHLDTKRRNETPPTQTVVVAAVVVVVSIWWHPFFLKINKNKE